MTDSADIVFLTRSLNRGGTERQLIELASGIAGMGINVAVVTFYAGGPMVTALRDTGIFVYSLNKVSRWEVLGFLLRLIMLLKRLNPRILYSYLGTSNIMAVLSKPFLRRTRIIWGVRSSNMDLGRYGWLDRFLFDMECRLAHFADSIIVNSRAGYDYAAAHGVPMRKMTIIPNGINTAKYFPDDNSRFRVRNDMGITNKEIMIGVAGRFDPMKGHQDFLQAASLLARERNGVRFVVVGDGPHMIREELLVMCRRLNIEDLIVWTGELEDMMPMYNAMDILTSSSIYGEGFSNVVGEAMACGVPCVVTDVGDSGRIVGDAGYVVPPGDPQGINNAWRILMDSGQESRRLLGEKARERVVKLFNIEKLVDGTISVLRREGLFAG